MSRQPKRRVTAKPGETNNAPEAGIDDGRGSAPFFWDGTFIASPAACSSGVGPADKRPATAVEFPPPTSDPQNWGEDPRPRGGFVNLLDKPSSFPFQHQLPNQPAMPPNYHFVGSHSQYAPFPAPVPSAVIGIPPPPHSMRSTPLTPPGVQSQPYAVPEGGDDDDDGPIRTDKRLAWTKEEDLRLMSAWLNNTNDPINGNNKKGDQYWGDVTRVYNSNTPKHRRREVKQAKGHWHSLNKMVYQFHCSFTKANAIYTSGHNDKQLMEKAHKFYEDDFKSGQFRHVDCWEKVKEYPKWYTYNEWLEKLKKKDRSEAGEAGQNTSSRTDAAKDPPRPMETKRAKAQQYGKGSSKEVEADMELIEKLAAVQDKSKDSRSDMMEMKQRLSTEKLETARLLALAAKENNEAKKQEKEAEMMKTYRALIVQDTIGMTDEMKAQHVKSLKLMSEMLSGK